jgi:hypothetical protein
MIEQDRDGAKVLPITGRVDGDEDLRFEILMAPASHGRERLLARAARRPACPSDLQCGEIRTSRCTHHPAA